MCSATSFLLLVAFCGTVSSLWYPSSRWYPPSRWYPSVRSPSYPAPRPTKRPCYGVDCPAIYCLNGQFTPPGKCCPQCKPDPGNNVHVPCKKDKDCAYVVCENPGEKVECHDAPSSYPPRRECHCHIPEECEQDFDCVDECGPGATCDDGACHGNDCDHT